MTVIEEPAPRGSVRRTMNRFAGFVIIPVLAMLSSLVTLPIIARYVDAATWVGIAVGQSVGSVGSIVATTGWTFNGPIQMVGLNRLRQGTLYRESISSRLTATLLVMPVAGAVAWLATPRAGALMAAGYAIAMCLGGLAPEWFCVGAGKPAWVTLYDAGPRILASVIGAGLVAAHVTPLVMPATLFIACVIGISLFTRMVYRTYGTDNSMRRPILRVVRSQMPSIVTTLVAAVYSTAAVAVVSANTNTSESATFASAARIYTFLLFGIMVTSQTVLSDTVRGHQSRRHLLTTAGLYAFAGVSGLLVLTFVAAPISRIAFTSDLALTRAEGVWFGLAFLVVAASTWLSLIILLPLGDRMWTMLSVCGGAVVGVPTLVVLSRSLGGEGGAIGLLVGQGTAMSIVAIGAIVVSRATRRGPDHRRIEPSPMARTTVDEPGSASSG